MPVRKDWRGGKGQGSERRGRGGSLGEGDLPLRQQNTSWRILGTCSLAFDFSACSDSLRLHTLYLRVKIN